MTRTELVDGLNDDETLIFLEGPEFDAALVGLVQRFGQPTIVCYDYDRTLAVLTAQGMTHDEAVEWFDFNIIGAWMGEGTPCFLHQEMS